MKEKVKKIIIGVILIAIMIILIVFISNKQKNNINNSKTLSEVLPIGSYEEDVELNEVFKINDIAKSEYEILKSSAPISSTYSLYNNEVYELQANVKLNDTISGRMIYVRGSKNLNILQTECIIDEYDDEYFMVEGYKDGFEMFCASYLGVDNSIQEEGTLYGTSKYDYPLPISESVYDEGMVYTKKFMVAEEYDYEPEIIQEESELSESAESIELEGTEPEIILESEPELNLDTEQKEPVLKKVIKNYEMNIYKVSDYKIIAELVYILD